MARVSEASSRNRCREYGVSIDLEVVESYELTLPAVFMQQSLLATQTTIEQRLLGMFPRNSSVSPNSNILQHQERTRSTRTQQRTSSRPREGEREAYSSR